jgi:hypothetical protein
MRFSSDVSVRGGRQRSVSGCAYRDGRVVCARVQLTIGRDDRLGLTHHERRYVLVRFCGRLDLALRNELTALVRRRGAAARRVAESLAPIEFVVDDPHVGRRRLVARLQPPQLRGGDLRAIEFGLRETA